MSALTDLIRHLVSEDTVLYECRHCGTTLEEREGPCPECESTEIVAYEFID